MVSELERMRKNGSQKYRGSFSGTTEELEICQIPNQFVKDNSIIDNENVFINDCCYLSSLLPYELEKKNRAALRAGLSEYLLLLSATLRSIDALELNDLKKFDALVGENACQIRAICISIIASKRDFCLTKLRDKVIRVRDKIYEFLEDKAISKLMNEGVSLEKLLEREELFILLNFQEAFIVRCFLLREVKDTNCSSNLLIGLLIKEKCTPKRLKNIENVSSSFADNIVRKLRKDTALQSVQFIREYARESQDVNLIRMLSDEFVINHNNHLLCTPMFWTYKAMLFAARMEKVKIILHTKLLNNTGSHFEVVDECWYDTELASNINAEESELSLKKVDWDDLGKMPCVIFQGAACLNNDTIFSRSRWESDLLKFSVDTVILAAAADHRQYPNEEDSDRLLQLLQDHEHETYRASALERGFSFKNPSIFFIQHVYATSTESLLLKEPSFSNSLHQHIVS